MDRKYIWLNPFLLGALVAGVLGNLSLGLIIAGLTVLVWGFNSGMNFITLTTIFLVILTANINLEIIFLYSLTLAFIIKQGIIFKSFDPKLAYVITFIISILFFPLWSFFLGQFPVQLLDELNRSGIILILAGFLLTLIRNQQIIKKEQGLKKIIELILIFVTTILGIKGTWLTIPFWIFSVLIINYLLDAKLQIIDQNYIYNLCKLNYLNKKRIIFLNIFFLLITIFSANILLPSNSIIIASIIIVFFYLYRYLEMVPLIEMVYLSFIIGILATRFGFLI